MNPTSASSTLRPRYLRTIAIGRYRSNFHSGTQVPSPDVRPFLEQAATRRRLWLLPGLHPPTATAVGEPPVSGLPDRFRATIGIALSTDRKSTRLNSSHLVISYA